MRYEKSKEGLASLLYDPYEAADQGNCVDNARYYLERGDDPNKILESRFDKVRDSVFGRREYASFNGLAPITLATYTGSLELCNLLISFGANVNVHNASGVCPLSVALSNNKKDLAERFLDFEQDLNIEAPYFAGAGMMREMLYKNCLLYIAACFLKCKAVKLMLKKGANPKISLRSLSLSSRPSGRRIIHLIKSYNPEVDDKDEENYSDGEDEESDDYYD